MAYRATKLGGLAALLVGARRTGDKELLWVLGSSAQPSGRPGRPRLLGDDLNDRLLRAINVCKSQINRGHVVFPRRYGDKCTDSDALRSLILRQYRRDLKLDGLTRPEIEVQVQRYRHS